LSKENTGWTSSLPAKKKVVFFLPKKRQKRMGSTLDADARIFRAASIFGTRKSALDAASPARRPCAERWRRKLRDGQKKKGPPGFEPGPEIMYFKVSVEVIPNSTELHQSSI
jgi:hypothetical protein